MTIATTQTAAKDDGEGLEDVPSLAEAPRPEGGSVRPPSPSDAPLAFAALVMVEAPPQSAQDWAGALKLVERAAFTIHDYEAKFVAIERDTRTFIQKVREEQLRTAKRIATLEMSVLEEQKRAEAAEASLAAALSSIANMRLEGEYQRRRLSEAEADLARSRANLRRVEDLLGDL